MWVESDIRCLLTDKLPGQSEKTAADLFLHHYGVKKNGNVDPKQVWERTRWIEDYLLYVVAICPPT